MKRRRNPIVVETPAERKRRLWLKYSEIVEIDAAKFKALFERHRGEKLAWSPSRSEAAMGRPTFNGYPIVYVDEDRLTVDVEDGRHRINEAARRGVPIQVACRRGTGKLLERLGIATRRGNPDDEALLRRLVVTVDDNPHHARGKRGNYKWLVAMDGDRPVATMFVKMARKYAYAKDVAVWVEYRRRGVASWLYRWVERKYGVKVIHSKDQTTDGKAFARGRRNPDDKDLLARLRFEFTESRSEPGLWTVVARDGATEIATADVFVKQRKPRAALVNRGGGRIIRGEVIEVLDAYKRRGVASAMVREIEKRFGGEVFVPPGEFSWEGQNFWMGRRKNPDDRELLSRLSLTLEHGGPRSIGWTKPVVDVRVLDGSRQVGAFLFIRVGDAVEAVDAYVNPSLRRRGVASWVYREVGRHFGTTVRHSKLQLEAGKAFARGRRR